MKSVMDHNFAQVPKIDAQRSSFDRSFGHKTTFDVGELVPLFVDEVLPGDTFNVNAAVFARLSTPIHPIMDNMHLDMHYFFVPFRLVWENFRKFMGEQENPYDSTDYTIPQSTFICPEGSLEDYFGIPTQTAVGVQHSALYARAYALIYDEWYRDQNLQDAELPNLGIGDSAHAGYNALARRGKRHDYFTSCLPWEQKGAPASLAIAGDAPVVAHLGQEDDYVNVWAEGESEWRRIEDDGVGVEINAWTVGTSIGSPHTGSLVARLEETTAATVNDLRNAFAVQRLLEQDARGGTRYSELVNSHFGVKFMDVSYRPEFLGGGTLPININPVAQTSSTDTTTPQGNLSAFGTAGGSNMGFTKSFTEHGIVMGIASVRADITYQQGLNRAFSRETKYDFYWPALANIGEQAVLNKEIYYDNEPMKDSVFGYQERYGEYRYKPSMITGKFRSNASGTLDAWHLSEEFNALPMLNANFIDDNTPLDRCVALVEEPHFILDSHFSMRCARPMPLYGVPGLGGRF